MNITAVLDTVGRKCPFPMMELQKYLSENNDVRSVTVIASDPNAVDDMYALNDLGEVSVKDVRVSDGKYWITIERL